MIENSIKNIKKGVDLKNILKKMYNLTSSSIIVFMNKKNKINQENEEDYNLRVTLKGATFDIKDTTDRIEQEYPISHWKKLLIESEKSKNPIIIVEKKEPLKPAPSKIVKEETTKGKDKLSYSEIVSIVKEKGSNRSEYTSTELEAIDMYYEGKSSAKGVASGTGVLNEFYTPLDICSKMWGLAKKHGINEKSKVLEPSCGTGRFFKFHENKSLITAYEVDETAYNISKILYPESNIYNESFESIFFQGDFHRPNSFSSEFDLVIGNPPYEPYKGYYAKLGEKEFTKAQTYDQYFITRGLDLLKSGGLLIFIVPSSFIRNEKSYNDIKEQIKKKAELLEAHRLPNDSFKHTSIGTDIIVFRKR